MKKKILSFVLALVLLCSMVCVGSVTVFAATGGDGSESNPFLVSSEAELNAAVEAATDTNNFIRVTDDFTVSSNIYIRKSVNIDFYRHTLSLQTAMFSVSSNDVTLQNGMITRDGNMLSIEDCEKVTVRNFECISTDYYCVSLNNSSATFDNCKFVSTYAPLDLSISSDYPYVVKDYTVTATQMDLIGDAPDGCAYKVTNQRETNDYDMGYTIPKINYNFSLNGNVISDVNSDVYLWADSATVSGGYSEEWKKDVRKTEVTYTVDPTYTVTIDPTVTLGGSLSVSADNVIVDEGKQVNVKLTATSGKDNAFTVATGKGATLTYAVTKDSNAVAIGDTVLSVNPAVGKTGSTTLIFSKPTGAQFSGTYTGTVTFTVSVDNIPA